jgi:hypothetical protein
LFSRTGSAVAAAVVSLCFVSRAAHADELQNQLVANAKATRTDVYSFRQTLALERTGEARKVYVEQFDPRRPASQRWTLVSVDGHSPTPKDLDDHRKVKRGPVPSYANLAEWIGAPATRSEPGAGFVLYRFASLPKGVFKIGSHDASPDTQAEALVNVKGKVPFVEKIRISSTKGFRMMLVASVQSMVINGRYRQLPDGHVVPNDSGSEINGSMMGKSGLIKSNVTFSDFQQVR